MGLSKDEIDLIAKQVALQIGQQDLKQVGQQGEQQIGDQIAGQIEKGISQAVETAKQTIQGSQQEKASFVSGENKFEETYIGEAFQNKAYNDGEMWTTNKKLITEREQKAAQDANSFDLKLKNLELKEKELAVAEREAKLRHQTKLDSIEVNERNNLATITHLANTLLVDFRTAAYHPISPNDSDKDAQGVSGGIDNAARVSRK